MKRALSFMLCAAAVFCLGASSAWAAPATIDISDPLLTWPITINKTNYPGGEVRIIGTKVNADGVKGIQVIGSGPDDKFTITFADGFHLTNRPGAFQVVDGAVVDMIIEGTVTFKTQSFTGAGGDAMITCGRTESSDNGIASTSRPSTLNIIGSDSDRSKNSLIVDAEGYSGAGIDGIRASEFDVQNNVLSFKDLTVTTKGMKGSNRSICGDTNEDVVFDNCDIRIDGGIPIAGGRIYGGSPCQAFASMHFINCALSLKSSYTGSDAGAINVLKSGVFTDSRSTWGRSVIFCDTEDNIAIVKATGASDAVKADSVVVAGGAVKLMKDTSGLGVNAKEINIVAQDIKGHPAKKEDQGSIIFYVDKTNVSTIHVDSGIDAIISGKNDAVVTPAAGAARTEWEAKTAVGGGNYTVGNVVGDFTLFDTNITPGKLFQPDYTIHDGEVIIVDEDSSLTISDKTKFVIEDDGHLILIGKDNANDGVIEVHGKTDEQLRQLIKEWGLGGSGQIINADTGTAFNNAGESWADIVNNSEKPKRDALDAGEPNLVVFGKDDAGNTVLAAVDPEISDDAYLLPANQTLDLKLYVLDPSDKTKLSDKYDPKETPPGSDVWNYTYLTSAIWPLRADGTYAEPSDAITKIIGTQTPVVAVSNGTASFPYTAEQIAELRKVAAASGIDSFVIWVYETDGADDTNYNGGYRRPFVFRLDTPEHTLQDIVDARPEVKAKIVRGPNTLVFDKRAQPGTVSTPDFVDINPTRPADLASMHEVQIGNGLALNIYIAKDDGEVPIDKASDLEGMNVMASLRPFDGLSIEQYRGLGDFVLKKGPHAIAGGYADFEFDPTELSRWARRHKISEFVIYVYNTDEHGNMKADKISQEFVFRIAGADTETHAAHCSGCDAGVSAGLAAVAAAAIFASRRRRGR